jgi:hypothetical protein
VSTFSVYAHAIAQVEPPAVGIHLTWMGPRPWIYSPGGWFIQRRKFSQRDDRKVCDGINPENIVQLRSQREIRLRFGTLTMREGSWLTSVLPQVQLLTAQPVLASSVSPTCEIFTLELDETQPAVQVQIQAEE